MTFTGHPVPEHPERTGIFPEVGSTAFHARPLGFTLRALDGCGLRGQLPGRPVLTPQFGSCTSARVFASGFFPTQPHCGGHTLGYCQNIYYWTARLAAWVVTAT